MTRRNIRRTSSTLSLLAINYAHRAIANL